MSEPTVLFATEGAVARITLNRPQALNSFTREMHRALWEAFDRIEGDKTIDLCNGEAEGGEQDGEGT